MKTALRINPCLALLALAILNIPCPAALAQGTAFSYQGQLNEGGQPANGIYDVRFTLYDSTNEPGNILAGPITNSATAVSNGLFDATLDFGAGVFSGASRWLQLDVRTNGATNFTALLPRQAILASPYAVMANNAGNLLGTLPAAQLSGTLPIAQLPSNVVTNGSAGLTLTGTFSGNGAGLRDVSPASISNNLATDVGTASGLPQIPSMLQLDSTNNTTTADVYGDLSLNRAAWGHLSQLLLTNGQYHGLFFGDSTGVDIFWGMLQYLNQEYQFAGGVQQGNPFLLWSFSYFLFSSPPISYSDPTSYWQASYAIGAGTNGVFYGNPPQAAGYYLPANLIECYYYCSETNGAATFETNTGAGWGPIGFIDETQGPEGHVQFISWKVPTAKYLVRMTATNGTFRYPAEGFGLIVTNSPAPIMYDCHGPGLSLVNWLLMTNNGNMACYLTNMNPTAIFYQQTKGLYTYTNYPAYGSLVTNLTYADQVLASAQQFQSNANPVYSQYDTTLAAQTLAIRNYCLTNGWIFWDDSALDYWETLQSLDDTVATNNGHLDAQGQWYAWQVFDIETGFSTMFSTSLLPTAYLTNGGTATNLSVRGAFSVTPTNDNTAGTFRISEPLLGDEAAGIQLGGTGDMTTSLEYIGSDGTTIINGGTNSNATGQNDAIQLRTFSAGAQTGALILYPSGGLALGLSNSQAAPDPGPNNFSAPFGFIQTANAHVGNAIDASNVMVSNNITITTSEDIGFQLMGTRSNQYLNWQMTPAVGDAWACLVSGYIESGMMFRDASTGDVPLQWSTPNQSITFNNWALNTGGMVTATNGFASRSFNSLGLQSIEAGSSPYTWKNTNNGNGTLFVGGGVVTALAINGTTLAGGITLTSLTPLPLQSNETATITYSTAPTLNWKPF